MARYPVELTSLDKLLFPADGITKGEIIDYYRAVAPYMLPYLRDRPINLERFPDGIGRPGFFQQAMPSYYPAWISGVEVEKAGGTVRHAVADSAAALVYLANQYCITFHAWLSRSSRLDYPDQMIFDLDPPPRAGDAVRQAARMLGALLRELGLAPFVKTSGSRGYHVVVPLDATVAFDAVRAFARRVADELVRRDPMHITTEVRKRARGRRIYVDILRNAYAHTAVAPFTLRARPGAPVAAPISWDELDEPAMRPDRFTIRNVLSRLDAGVDPWSDFRRRAHRLSKYI